MNSILKKAGSSGNVNNIRNPSPSPKTVRFLEKKSQSLERYSQDNDHLKKIQINANIIDQNNNNYSQSPSIKNESSSITRNDTVDYIELPIHINDTKMVALNRTNNENHLVYKNIENKNINSKSKNTSITINSKILPCLIDYPLDKPVNTRQNVNSNNLNDQKRTQSNDNSNRKIMDDKIKERYKQWYKQMYTTLHKDEKTENSNPYKPTYTFPSSKDDELYNCLDECFNQPYIPFNDDIFRINKKHFEKKESSTKSTDNPFHKKNQYTDTFSNLSPKSQSINTSTNLNTNTNITSIDHNNNNTNTNKNKNTTMPNNKSQNYDYESYNRNRSETRQQPNFYKIVQKGGDIPLLGLQKYLKEKATSEDTNYTSVNENFNKITSLCTSDSNTRTKTLHDQYQCVREHRRTVKQVRFVKNNIEEKVNGISLPLSKSLNNLGDHHHTNNNSDDEDNKYVISGSGYIVRGYKDEILNLNNPNEYPTQSLNHHHHRSMNDLLLIDNHKFEYTKEENANSSSNSTRSSYNNHNKENESETGTFTKRDRSNLFSRNDCDSQFSDNYNTDSKNTEQFSDSSHSSSNEKYLAIAIALNSFKAQYDTELSFRRGDIILVQKKINDDWYTGEHHGFFGMFPVKFVQFLTNVKSQSDVNSIKNEMKSREGLAKARYDFFPQHGEELELHRNDMVSIIRRVDANWYEGYIGDQQGIFPVNYVRVIKEPIEREPKEIPVTHKVKEEIPVKKTIIRDHSSESVYHSNSNVSCNTTSNTDDSVKIINKIKVETNQKLLKPHSLLDYSHIKPEMFSAMRTFKALNETEIDLNIGDLVLVYKICENGWYIGLSLQTGKFGSFPGNYVVPHQISD